MRRSGLTVALAFAAFAAAEEAVPLVGATAVVEGQAADVAKAMQNILIQTEGTVPSSVKLGGDSPLAFQISNHAGEDAVVLVIPELKVAAAKPDADKPAASLGCYTIGDDVAKVALLMCEGMGTDVATPAKEGYEWVKGTITNEGPETICQLKFASADLKLAELPDLQALPADLSKLTPFKLEPKETMNYAFQLPVDAAKGIPTIGIKDSLGPCGMIEKAKEALAAALPAGDAATATGGILAGATDAAAAAKAAAEDAAALAKKSTEEAAAALAAAAGDAKAAAGDAAETTKEAAADAAEATVKAGEDAAAAVTEAVAEVPKVAEVDTALPKVGDIKLNGEAEEAAKATEEVTSPAPKMSASVMGVFTVAVLVAVQLLL